VIKTQRRQLIALLATALIVISTHSVIADEGPKDSTGEVTIQLDAPEPATTVLDDDSRSTFYPAFAFRPRGTDGGEEITDYSAQGCVHVNNSTLLTTEVLLPHGAHIDEVTLYGEDNGAGSLTLYLSEFASDGFPASGPSLTDLFAASASSGLGKQVVSDTTPSMPNQAFVDTVNSNYVLQVRASGGADTRFCGGRIIWSVPEPGAVLHPLDACAIYDTRPGKGGREATLGANEVDGFLAIRNTFAALGGDASDCGIASDAEALLLSVNVVRSTANGGVKLWTKGEPRPAYASLIFEEGVRTSTAVPVVLSSDNRIIIQNLSKGRSHIQLVVLGWYGPPKS
jgi:hypothetical protein